LLLNKNINFYGSASEEISCFFSGEIGSGRISTI